MSKTTTTAKTTKVNNKYNTKNDLQVAAPTLYPITFAYREGRRPTNIALACTMRVVNTGDKFVVPTSERSSVNSLARSLPKTFKTKTVNDQLEVTCVRSW